jgi:hypothetical protein
MTSENIWKPGNLIQWQSKGGNGDRNGDIFLILAVSRLEQWTSKPTEPWKITVLLENGLVHDYYNDKHMRDNPYFKLIYDANEEE